MICTNEKSGLDHSCGKTTGAFLVIDSIVRLSGDIVANVARLAGKAQPLRPKITGEEKLVSRNGGKPYALIQLECWNPSTPMQKTNNLHQLFDAHPELDS